LAVVAGCQLPDLGDKSGDDNGQNNGDPSNINPGQGQVGNQNGVPTQGQNGQSAPLARKLALDLSGVAGFAILGQDSTASGTSTGTGNTSTPTSGSAGTPGAAGSPSSSLWLSSTATGQVLTAAAPSSAAAQRVAQFVGRAGLQARALGTAALPGNLAQTEPGAAPSGSAGASSGSGGAASGSGGASAGSGTASGGGASSPPTSGDSTADVGAQTGLLKITDDGSVEPALVALPNDSSGAAAGGASGAQGSGATGAGAAAGTSGATPDGAGGASGAGADGTKPAAGGAAGVGSGGAAPSGAAGATPGTAAPGTVQNQPNPNPGFSEPIPRVTALGLSPDGSVYVLFERGFVYRQPTTEELSAPDFNPGSPTSPFRCQLFRADGSWKNGAPANKNLAELQCVTSDYQVPTWDTKKVMQFDASGKLYFRAVTTGNPQGVFVQFDPVSKLLSEKVNANICWHDVQVTPRGSLFYTGTSGSNGDCGGGNGTSFFRYVSADNHLTEIARDWWNFKYLAEQDPADPNNERIIFYGPDPNATSNIGWGSACLYRYDPGIATVADRPQKLVDCFSDAFSYVNGTQNMGPAMPQTPSPEELPGFRDRCESSGQLFIGGDGVTALSQLEDGTLFVVGTFQHKLAGVLQCGIDVQGDHCATLGTGIQGDAIDTVNTNSTDCINAGHHWISVEPGCSNPDYTTPQDCVLPAIWNPGGGGFRHYEMTGSDCAASIDGATLQHINCQAPNNSNTLSEQVTGLGYLVPGVDGAPGQIRLLSDPTEHVEHYWPVPGATGPELFYSVYSAGQYNLRRVTQLTSEGQSSLARSSVLDDYEVYNLQRDPSAPNRVLFDALEFSTNSYVFGSIDPTLASPADVKASLQVLSGVSGRVETLVILPNF
jgi:hypothetical protein